MSTNTHDTPDNPYRARDPWGARSPVPQVFTVQSVPAPMRRVFKPASQAPSAAPTLVPAAPSSARADRLQLTPVAEPYDEPPPPRAEPEAPQQEPAADLVTARRPPFAGAAPVPTARRTGNPFVGPEPTKPERAPQPDTLLRADPAPVPTPLAPFARSEPAPRLAEATRPAPAPEARRETPAPVPAPEARRETPVAVRPVPAAAIAPPTAGFTTLTRAAGGRRIGRPMPRGLLAASVLVLAGVAAVAAAVVLKPWASHPSAVDTLAAESAKPPAPLTITPSTDPFAAGAAAQPGASPSSIPVKTATAAFAPRVAHAPVTAASGPAPVPTLIDVGAPAPNADAATQPGANQAAAASAAPPKAAPAPIVVTPVSATDVKPAATQPDPAKASAPPPPKPAGELIPTSHLPGDSVGPHQ